MATPSATPRAAGRRDVLAAVGALSLAAVALGAGCGEPEAPPGALRGRAPGPGEGAALWVLSYNVNFEQHSAETIPAIAEADADLVFLQEVDPAWERSLRDGLSDRYPHMSFRSASDEGGMAILSRHPLRRSRLSRAPRGPFPAWCATVSSPLGDLEVLHVHLHPPLDDRGRLAVGYFTTGQRRLRELIHHLRCFERPPDLVVGDFNEGEGEAISHLTSFGLREAQAAFPPVERTWTWRTSAGELTGRPDHIFHGPALEVAAVQVMERGGSDHRPLRAALVPRAAEPTLAAGGER